MLSSMFPNDWSFGYMYEYVKSNYSKKRKRDSDMILPNIPVMGYSNANKNKTYLMMNNMMNNNMMGVNMIGNMNNNNSSINNSIDINRDNNIIQSASNVTPGKNNRFVKTEKNIIDIDD